MSDSQKKRAIRRLVLDLEELRKEPVANVSASPLESNIFEWHCNIRQDDVIYHLILFMPENYPFMSPSAEFLPAGFAFSGGATMNGVKGTKVCLNIFSDFAKYHTEWQNQKGYGWSPGYTTQTVLMNLVAFLAETAGDMVKDRNSELSKSFTCPDCGHTYQKPLPPFQQQAVVDDNSKGKGKAGRGLKAKNTPTAPQGTSSEASVEIVDYISKARFGLSKPESRDTLYGYGLVVSGPTHRPSLTTPCEFLSGESFFGMKASMKVVHSSLKEELKFFLPMYIHPTHGNEIQDTFEKTINAVGAILPSVKKTATLEEKILKTIPNLMAATVVEFSKGTQHTSDNSLNGYFALHRLLLWALETYPDLQLLVENRLQEFIDVEDNRSKEACPHIGEWLMLLSASQKYRWTDAAEAYLCESFRRNVMWYVKDTAKLGFLDTDKAYRIRETFTKTEVSRKILAFQVLFLDIALPSSMTREQIIQRYDAHLGFPTSDMVSKMKDACDVIKNQMATYEDWFKVLKLEPWSQAVLFERLVNSVKFAILHDGYHWSLPKSAGGWTSVMTKYKDMRKEFSAKTKPETSEASDTATLKKRNSKQGTKTQAKSGAKVKGDNEVEEDDETVSITTKAAAVRGGRGKRARGRTTNNRGRTTNNRGRAAKTTEDHDYMESENEDEDEMPKGRGGRTRGRGTKRKVPELARRPSSSRAKKARK